MVQKDAAVASSLDLHAEGIHASECMLPYTIVRKTVPFIQMCNSELGAENCGFLTLPPTSALAFDGMYQILGGVSLIRNASSAPTVSNTLQYTQPNS